MKGKTIMKGFGLLALGAMISLPAAGAQGTVPVQQLVVVQEAELTPASDNQSFHGGGYRGYRGYRGYGGYRGYRGYRGHGHWGHRGHRHFRSDSSNPLKPTSLPAPQMSANASQGV